ELPCPPGAPRALHGEVAEWLKAHAWKVCIRPKAYRGFESRPLRHKRNGPHGPVSFMADRVGGRARPGSTNRQGLPIWTAQRSEAAPKGRAPRMARVNPARR